MLFWMAFIKMKRLNVEDKYLTITQLNRYIKFKIDKDANLNTVFLKGEISNFKEL